MLKVSEDVSTANAVASMQQQSGLVMTSVSSLAQKFPELKSNEQYKRLIDSIQKCEEQLEFARQAYNAKVKQYNTHRSSIPHVFYANALQFGKAPYLEFQGNEQVTNMGSMNTFSADDDGERLNALLGAAGNSALKLGSFAISNSVSIANKALESGKILVDAAQEKARQRNSTAQPASDVQTLANRDTQHPPIPQDLPEVLFHYLDANKTPTGPVTAHELRTLIASGAITLATLVAATGAKEWISAEQALSSSSLSKV
jgi:LemA protein